MFVGCLLFLFVVFLLFLSAEFKASHCFGCLLVSVSYLLDVLVSHFLNVVLGSVQHIMCLHVVLFSHAA